MMTMFDPDEFRSPQDSGREPKPPAPRQRRYAPSEGAMRTDEGWFIISANAEQLDKVHRVAETLSTGSVVTACEQHGRVVYAVPSGSLAHLCERCDR